MKTLATTSMILFAATLFAQEKKVDTTVVRVGALDVQVFSKSGQDSVEVKTEKQIKEDDNERKNKLTHWAGIDFGINMLTNTSKSIGLEGDEEWLRQDHARSMHWSINPWEQKLRLYKDYVGIYTGAGITWNNFGLANDVDVQVNRDSIFGVVDTIKRTKNKLRTTALRVPLMLEFNTSLNPKKTIHVSAGVIGSWIFSTVRKQEYSDNDVDFRIRNKTDFHVNPFALDAAVRAGYRNVVLFANYALTPMFANNKGPELYPLTVGIQLVPF